MYVNEPATREILLFLARHYVEGYRKKDKNIVTLLSNVILYFIPYFEQKENYEKKCVTDDQAEITGPLLIATNQPNEQKATDSLWKMLQREQFDIMFSLEGGSMSIKFVFLIFFIEFMLIINFIFDNHYCLTMKIIFRGPTIHPRNSISTILRDYEDLYFNSNLKNVRSIC